MRRLHLIIGAGMFIAFVVSGRFMRNDFPDKEAIDQELRLLMRSRHIYILFSALIHLSLAAYFRPTVLRAGKVLQYSGSVILLISSVYLVCAFIVETYTTQHFTDLSRSGIYASLAGVALHLIGGLTAKYDL